MNAPPMTVPAPANSILIVEDEAVVACDLQEELQALGYVVVGIADNAVDALTLAHSQRPRLVLMDIMLKGDVDGIQVAARLRHELSIPVIFLTSFSDAETVGRAALEGAYGYLTKPFQIKELRAGIEIALWKSHMERQLRDSDRWFALTLRCVQDGVVSVGADRTVRFMNVAAEHLLGWTSDEAAGHPVAEVVRFDETGVSLPDAIDDALRLGRVTGIRHSRVLLNRRSGRRTVDESTGPVHDETGLFIGSVIVLRDVSDRLRQEALLRRSDERFRNAFEHAPLGMALVALDGKFLQVNKAMCQLLHRPSSQLLDTHQQALTHAADSAHESARLADLLHSGEALTQFEKRYMRGGGAEPVWVLVNASLIALDGDASCLLYQVHDLSAQKQAAEHLAELAAERVRRETSELAGKTRSAFLSRVSHEMRTPLNAVLGFSELLQIQHTTGQPISSGYSKHILDAGKHLLALVDDVLDLQRASDGMLKLSMDCVALDEVMPSVLGLLTPMAEARDVRMSCRVAAGLCIHADATRIRQILLNLGSNAVKYNVHGGSVVFSAALNPAGRVTLLVEDSGIGMSAEQLTHLYEPFNRLGRESLKVQGVGLGLVITHKLVEQMGGTMRVESQAGTGSAVHLEFPAWPEDRHTRSP